MFKKLGSGEIVSNEGFSVKILGRTGLQYTEGSKTLHVNSEVLAGPSGLGIYKNSIKSWDLPYDNETIDESKRDAIVENIRRAFRFDGYEIAVI